MDLGSSGSRVCHFDWLSTLILTSSISSQILYSTIQTTDDAIYIVGLASSFASYMLHVVALSPATGEVLASVSVPSTISNGLDDFLVLSDIVVWIEKNSIKSFALSPSLLGRSRALPAASYEKLLNIGLGSHGMFIAVGTDGASQLVTCEDGKLVTSKNFKSPSSSESFYAGGLDMDHNPYVSHLHVSTATKVRSLVISVLRFLWSFFSLPLWRYSPLTSSKERGSSLDMPYLGIRIHTE